jgi:hypothetical protein
MTSSRITALLAACLLALPGAALAAPRTHKAAHHRVVHKATAVPQPTIIVPHRYDAGGDGGETSTPTGLKVNLFDPVNVAIGLGNTVLGQLGLPPLPALPIG